MVGGFVLNTHRSTRSDRVPPILESILPSAPVDWDLVRTENLKNFAPILKTDHLIERTYVRAATTPNEEEPLQITVYLAYWDPGQAAVSHVAMHTPDACWPGNGWTAEPVVMNTAPVRLLARVLPLPQYRSFTNKGTRRHVWYWHLYAGRSITQTNPYSAVELLNFAWRYGFRTAGEQLFVRISSNRPWSEISDEPLLGEILGRLQPYGL